MKKYLLIIIFIFCNQLFSQNLTIDELINLRDSNISSVEEFLSGKQWKLIKSEEPTERNFGSIMFAYNKSDYDNSATSFVRYIYSNTSYTRRIGIQINSLEKYNSYLSRIKQVIGCKLISTKINDDGILKVYGCKGITFMVKVKSTSNYYITILDNSDYYQSYVHDENEQMDYNTLMWENSYVDTLTTTKKYFRDVQKKKIVKKIKK